MYVVRDSFKLRFGMFKDAAASIQKAIKDGLFDAEAFRFYTDFTGDSYRLILESKFQSLNEYEGKMQVEMQKQDWKDWYQKFKPFVESSHREILRELSW